MRRVIGVFQLLAIMALLSLGAEARKVKVDVDFDQQMDFSKFKTYAWMEHAPVARPMLALEVVGATDYELRAFGLKNVDQDPDLLINFYGGINTHISIAASDPTYTANGGIAPVDSSMWSAGAGSFTGGSGVYVQKGTLVIEIVDAQTKKLLWRGAAVGNLDTNLSKAFEGIDHAVEKLFREYPLRKSHPSRK